MKKIIILFFVFSVKWLFANQEGLELFLNKVNSQVERNTLFSINQTKIDFSNYKWVEDEEIDFDLKKTTSEINFKDTLLIAECIKYFTEKNPVLLSKIVVLYLRNKSKVEPIFDSLKLPKALGLLPILISGYDFSQTSTNGGVGYWLLSYPQAIRYGLGVSAYTDQRRNLKKATYAAGKELRRFYTIHKDWSYATLAYLQGSSIANKYSTSSLPKEHKYFQAVWGAINYLLTYHNYEDFVANQAIFKHNDLALVNITLTKRIKLTKIKKYINVDKIKYYNQELCTEIIPKGYTIRGSVEDKKFIQEDLSRIISQQILAEKRKQFINKKIAKKNNYYTVKSGDVIGLIAERFGTSIAQIKQLNKIKGTTIYIGQKLKMGVVKPLVTLKKQQLKEQKIKKNTFQFYTIKSGDSLWKISRNYPGVSMEDLMKWNRLSDKIYPGQKIKIYL